jgi:hypothetical protein
MAAYRLCHLSYVVLIILLQNAVNRGKPGFGKGSGVDRSRTTTTV